ncbi:MAG: hypothetical protein HC837_09455 [Chloroflexaceae bacterium]|nr:hypothetical protein [Chloroflexaceae bacterium]
MARLTVHQSKPTARPPALHALHPGEQPYLPGLYRDKRGIVVGTHGLVVMQNLRHRAAFLASLSHVVDLARGFQVEQPTAPGRHRHGILLITCRPPDADDPPSFFYDVIDSAIAGARLSESRAQLYIGNGQVFVPYHDHDAPYGYDVQGQPEPEGRVILRPQGIWMLPEPQPEPLLDALLTVPLQPAPQVPQATMVTVLADRRMVVLIADYVQRHGLAYTVRFVSWKRHDQHIPVALFDIIDAHEVRPIPAFVIDFLQRFPYTTLLHDALAPATLEQEPLRRMLITYGHRTPLYLPHIQHVLPPRSLLILSEQPWGPALIDRLPPRQPMQHLTNVTIAVTSQVSIDNQSLDHVPIERHITLVRDRAATNLPIHGLLLDQTALHRLHRLVRVLPVAFFQQLQIASNGHVAVLIAPDSHRGIDTMPLGQALIRTNLDGLLLPRGWSLHPTLPPDLLVPALAIKPDTLTILTRHEQYHVLRTSLQPLGAWLHFQPPAWQHTMTIQPVDLPALVWHELATTQPTHSATTPDQDAPSPSPDGIPATDEGATPQRSQRKRRWLLGSRDNHHTRSDTTAETLPFTDELRQRARQLEQSGAYEIAAAFYAYLKDDRRAASCYRRLIKQERS